MIFFKGGALVPPKSAPENVVAIYIASYGLNDLTILYDTPMIGLALQKLNLFR